MEQRGTNACAIQLHLGDDSGDVRWVDKIRITRLAFLPVVLFLCETIRLPDQLSIYLRLITLYAFYNVVDGDHRFQHLFRILPIVNKIMPL